MKVEDTLIDVAEYFILVEHNDVHEVLHYNPVRPEKVHHIKDTGMYAVYGVPSHEWFYCLGKYREERTFKFKLKQFWRWLCGL